MPPDERCVECRQTRQSPEGLVREQLRRTCRGQGTHTCVERSVSPQCFSQPFPPLLLSVQARDKNVGSRRYWPLRALLSCLASLFSDPNTVHTLDQIWWKENISIPSVSAENQPPKRLKPPQGHLGAGTGCQDGPAFQTHPAGQGDGRDPGE